MVNAILVNARSVPQIEVVNPCTPDGLYTLQYYHPYPNDDSRFIECDPWGQMYVKMCPEGSKWNSWISTCVVQVPDESGNKQKISSLKETQSCSFYGNSTCKNGGYCNRFMDESKCFCLSNFVGFFCEEASTSMGAFGQIINNSFSIEEYKQQRPQQIDSLLLNTTIDTSVGLDELTKKRIEEYLSKYPNGEMRFDILINYLVQDLLKELYPASFTLKEFIVESEVTVAYTTAIPSLLQTAKYSYDNFDKLFSIFVEVLDRLADYLPKQMPNVKEEAKEFFNVYDMIFTRSNNVSNYSSGMMNRTELSRDEMRQKIHEDFNATLNLAYDLFKHLNRFDDDLSVRGANYSNIEMRLAVLNFTFDPMTGHLITELTLSTQLIWESMSFYGFWYVVSSYVVPNLNQTSNHVAYSMDGMAHVQFNKANPDKTFDSLKDVTVEQPKQSDLKQDELSDALDSGLVPKIDLPTSEPITSTTEQISSTTMKTKLIMARRKFANKMVVRDAESETQISFNF